MDENVIAAMARWPNVPDVYGWLSLSAAGQWQLYPQGPGSSPETITNPQIIDFIGRNYACDDGGRWYFQNGPQRVFVRLDAAPWIVRTDVDADGRSRLVAHTGAPYGPVRALWLDAKGRLFVSSPMGAGLIAGRDMPALLDSLHTSTGPLADQPQALPSQASPRPVDVILQGISDHPIPLGWLTGDDLEDTLEFIAHPAG